VTVVVPNFLSIRWDITRTTGLTTVNWLITINIKIRMLLMHSYNYNF